MPNYDYQCSECGRELEITHSINVSAVERQKHIKRGGNGESCNGKLQRLVGAGISFKFKGGAPTPKNYI